MKTLLLSAIVPAFVLTSASASAIPPITLSNSGPVTISWKVSQGATNFTLASAAMNKISSKQTNYVFNYKAKTTTANFTTANLLALLTNSFKVNFSPTNIELVTEGFTNLYVVDKKHPTTVLLNVAPVLRVFPPEGSFHSGGMKTTIAVKSGVRSTNDTLADTTTSRVTLHYNDSGELSSNVSDFWFHGVSTVSLDGTYNGTSAAGTGQLLVQDGSGGGTIRGTNVIISGTCAGSINGTSSQYGGNQ